jgi:hypothetical protein
VKIEELQESELEFLLAPRYSHLAEKPAEKLAIAEYCL